MSDDMSTLTGAYAIDALDEPERGEFEQHLESCERCAQEVRELQATAAQLGSELATPPPQRLKQQVLDEVARTPQEGAPADDAEVTSLAERRRRRERRPWAFRLTAAAAAAAIVLAGALGGVAVYTQQQLTEAEQLAEQAQGANVAMAEVMQASDATVTSSAADGATGTVVASRELGRTVFLGEGMRGISEDETYQLWLIGPDGPDSAGLLDRDEQRGSASAVAELPQQADQVAVTVEPEGGSEQPTTEPIMAIELDS